MKKNLIFLIIIGFLIRFIISLYDSYGDINLFFIPWAKNISQYGFSGFYSRINNGIAANYPPLALYLFTICYQIGRQLAEPIVDLLWKLNLDIPLFPSRLIQLVTDQKILLTFIKLPPIISDIFLAIGAYLLSFKLINKHQSKLPILVLVSVLFNPALIYNSALWGQIDIIPVTFTIWSIYFLANNRLTTSVVLLSLGLLSKQTIVFLLPVYILLFIKKSSGKKLLLPVIAGLATFFIVFLPFYQTGNLILFPFVTYIKVASTFGGNVLSAHAFNIWWITTNTAHALDTILVFNLIQAATLSKILVGIPVLIILFQLIKSKINFKYSLLAISIISMATFLFLTRMHERHLLPALPFLLLATSINPWIYGAFMATTFFQFFNLYAAWNQPPVNWLMQAAINKPLVATLTIFQILLLISLIAYFTKTSFLKKKNYKQQKSR